jgi:hypothetical protein
MKEELYLISSTDIESFETRKDNPDIISGIHLKSGARIMRIKNDPDGKKALSARIKKGKPI